MEYRRLERTNLEVSAVGLGTIPLINVEEKEAIKVMRRAIERCLYDSRWCYGFYNILNYYTLYGLKEVAEPEYKRLSVKPDACVECGKCEEKCPYSLPIREMLEKTVLLFSK